MERPVWLEELRLKFDLALNIDRPNRRAQLHNLIHEFLLRRNRIIHARPRTEPRIEEISVVLDSNFLERFLSKVCSFLGCTLFVGIQPPPRATKQRQHND
jgi:hypothetical protein